MDRPLTVCILVVSTTAAQDRATDTATSTLEEVFRAEGDGRWKIKESAIVTDDVLQIQRQIKQWTDSHSAANLLITTGGTGFAVSDGTPEAVQPLLHKEAPGLVHGMLAASLKVTPFAMMSRPVAGVRNQTIIVTLPGSPKGAKENLQAVIKLLPHACLQAEGADSRALHKGGVKQLESEAGISGSNPSMTQKPDHHYEHDHAHSHSHPHTHSHSHAPLIRHRPPESLLSNDLSLGPTRRYRTSPYPKTPVSDALDLIAQHSPQPQSTVVEISSAFIHNSLTFTNSVVASDVKARENVPAFRASIVDGYAVVVPSDGAIKGVFPVVSVSHATAGGEMTSLREGQVARVTTGAPLPPGATSVIMVEDTVLKTMTADGKEEAEIEIHAENVKEGENVREVGSDVKKDDVILERGDMITAVGGEVGLLASVGATSIQLFRKPVVAILSTGDEIVEPNRAGPLRHGEVRDTNRMALMYAAQAQGYEVVDMGIAKDKVGTLEETLREALRKAEVLITTGGVSMGELDLLKPTIERSLGGTIHFGRVAMKPGMPTTFATVPIKGNSGERLTRTIFSLPGNPASALVTFHLFVLPSLHQQSGVTPVGLPKVSATLAHEFRLDPRPEFHRALVSVGSDGLLTASSTGGQRSSRVGSLRSANALVCLPGGTGVLEKGTKVDVMLMSQVRNA